MEHRISIADLLTRLSSSDMDAITGGSRGSTPRTFREAKPSPRRTNDNAWTGLARSFEWHYCCAELSRAFFSKLISTRPLVCLAVVPPSAATVALPMPTTKMR